MSKSWFVAGIMLLSVYVSTAQGGIDFQDVSLEEAVSAASKNGKLIFVEGFVNWSQPSSILENYTLTDQEVAAYYNEHFINLRLDMEEFPGAAIAEDYSIDSFPALLFFDGEGQIVHRGCGAVDAEEMLQLGKQALGEENLSRLSEQFESGERSGDFLIKFSLALENACLDRSMVADRYFSETDRSEWMNETSWAMLALNVDDPYSAPFQYLMSYHDMFVMKYGKDTVDAKIYNTILDQLIGIYEGADLTYFATQALRHLMSQMEFQDKNELVSLADLKASDLKADWPKYAESAVKVVKEQQVSDPDQLNEFSWKFYLFVEDKSALQAAKGWMEQVINEYPDATYYDTYASLCYKLGEIKEAVKLEKKALQAAQSQLEDPVHYESQLQLFESALEK